MSIRAPADSCLLDYSISCDFSLNAQTSVQKLVLIRLMVDLIKFSIEVSNISG